MTKLKIFIALCISSMLCIGCFYAGYLYSKQNKSDESISPTVTIPPDTVVTKYDHIPIASRFDYPVGWPDAKGFHDLQSFTVNNHLGEDWNDYGGCNNDLGKSVHTIAEGYVSDASDYAGGWGNVVRVIHKYKENNTIYFIESLYAHLEKITVTNGQYIKAGQQLGTIGNAHGKYCAHLHLELRSAIDLPLGGGYSTDTNGYISPSNFIKRHRKL